MASQKPIVSSVPFRKLVFSSSFYSYFFVISLFLYSGTVNGQRVGFGPKIGPNVSVFRGDFAVDGMRGPRFGLTAGGFLNFRFKTAKQFQFQIELLFSQRGNHAEFVNTITTKPTDPPPSENLKYSLSYIEVPLLFKYMLNKSGMTRPYLFAGPVYSGLLTARLKDEVRATDVDIKDAIKRDDFGLMLGWGITTFFIDRWYHLDIRYYHGFLDTSEFLTNDLKTYNVLFPGLQTISSYRNSTLSITIGIGLEKRETFFLR